MNAFRKWWFAALPAIAVALATAMILAAKGNSHASKDWLTWLVLTTPLYTVGLGARSRPCRRPRWLGGR